MPYTDDPASEPADAVRFYLGDTKTPGFLTDNEVAFLLSENSDDPLRAAARGAEVLAARSAGQADEKTVGPLKLKYTNQARRWGNLAAQLWRRASVGRVAPYAGGISVTDKLAKASNWDRVAPSFTRRMMTPPDTDTRNSTREDRLSPPPVELP